MRREIVDPAAVMAGAGWLSTQPARFRQRVLELSELRHYDAGTTVSAMGDPPGDIFGLVEGELTVLIAPEEGMPPLLAHVARPGWWVGEAALITNTPRRASIVARWDSSLLCLSPQAVDRLAGDDPATWRRLAQITVGHLDHALGVVASLSATDARVRVALALRRLAVLSGSVPPSAVVYVSQEELGELARLTRNALRPVLVEREQLGLIRRAYRQIEIPDVSRLLRFANDLVTDQSSPSRARRQPTSGPRS